MTTLATNPTVAPTAVSPEVAALLESQADALQTAVQNALRQHLFQNQGRLMTPRQLPAASQEITQSYLHYLRHADEEQLAASVQDLTAQGLGHLSALAVVDALYSTSRAFWADAADSQASAAFHSYRHQFLYQYMQSREQITVRARENFYQNVEAALERQVSQERALRQQLEAQSSQLAKERALLTSLLDSIPDLIFYKDVDGAYLGCNTAFAEFAGRAEADLVGKTDFDMFPEETAAFFREQDLEMLASGQARRNEEWVDYPDGRRALLDTLKTPFYDADRNLLGLIGISRDITAAYEAQAELLRLGYVVEQSLDGTAVADLDGYIQFTNPAWATMHGYTPEELIGQHLSIFHTEEQLVNEVLPANQKAVETGQQQRSEIGHVRKDGSTFPTLMTIGLLRDHDGKPIGFAASAQDITEQKRTQEALLENQARLAQAAQVIENSPVILFRWRNDEERSVEFVSENVARFGYTPEELRSGQRPYASLIHPEDLTRVVEELDDYAARNIEQFSQEYRIITKDGQVRWVDDRTTVVFDDQGQIDHYEGIVLDATERRAFEEALRESEERYRNILENANEIIYTLSLDGVFQYVSPAWTELLGHPVEEVQGELFAPFVHPDDVPACSAFLERIITTGESQRGVEYRVRHQDGSWRWHASNGAAVKDAQGKVIYYVGMAQDVTDKRESEAALAKRARELQAVAEVGTAVATTLDLDILMQRVVNLARSRFKLYHAHIYLLDETGKYLTLAAGAGDVGQQMVAQGWQIPLDRENSLVARAARSREGEIVNDVRTEPGFLPNPLLPDTRAELAAPIIAGDELLGVWDVQSDTPGHFTDEDVLIQATLATQLGVAMQNARSFAQSEMARQELSQLTRRLTRQAWQDYLKQQEEKDLRVAVGHAPENGQAVSRPLVVQGETIGRLALAEPQALPEEAAEIMAAVADRLSSHIENLRLTAQTEAALAQTEQQANRLAILNEMGAALSRAATLQEIYQIAALYTANVLPCDMVALALLEPSGEQVSIVSLQGEIPAEFSRGLFPLEGTSLALALQEQKPLLAPQDFAGKLPLDAQLLAAQGIPGFICAPLLSGERPLGALNIGSKRANAYGPTDVSLAQQIVSLLSATLESRRLFEETRRRAEREALVNTISQKIQSAPTIQSAMQTAVTELGKALQVRRAVVQLNETGPLPAR